MNINYPKEYTEYEIKWLEENESKLKYKSNSRGGIRLKDNIEDLESKIYYTFDLDKLDQIGGTRLVTFYLCGSNYELASKELGIKEATLRVYLFRIKQKLTAEGFGPNELHKLLRRKS